MSDDFMDSNMYSNLECEIEDLEGVVKHLAVALGKVRELLKEKKKVRDYWAEKLFSQNKAWLARNGRG
ncbi:MAG: hypothetical protein LBC75_02555 [Fibromonadaceae bacterium]|jgi:hypothetical protein|nr:hypothetical protein [Fibromonadaceae bacterium]